MTRRPAPDPLSALHEQEREVTTSELWGGQEFHEVFPTFSDEELAQIRESLGEDEDEESFRLHTDD